MTGIWLIPEEQQSMLVLRSDGFGESKDPGPFLFTSGFSMVLLYESSFNNLR